MQRRHAGSREAAPAIDWYLTDPRIARRPRGGIVDATQHPDLPALLRAVIAAAEEAGRRLAAEFARPDGPRGAAGHADVDDEIEAELRDRLLALLRARWRGEESGVLAGPGGPYCWLVDPHDGTSAFLAGASGSSVSIA